MTLDLHLGDASYEPGAAVRGHVTVVSSGECRALSVCLAFCSASRDYSAIELTTPASALVSGFIREGSKLPFELPLPEDARPTFRGTHGSLYWTVEAWCDRRGVDAVASREFTVAA